jgi:Rrf2 family protein
LVAWNSGAFSQAWQDKKIDCFQRCGCNAAARKTLRSNFIHRSTGSPQPIFLVLFYAAKTHSIEALTVRARANTIQRESCSRLLFSGGRRVAIGQFFSQRFGYGIHALAYIAKKPQGELTTLPALAAWMRSIWPGASDAYLSNVVQRMARGRLLRSHRGVAGGYSLARAASKITVRDVVEVLEGIDTDRCLLSLEDECPVMGRCAIQRKMHALEEGFLNSLAEVTVQELSDQLGDPPPSTVPIQSAPKAKRKPKKKARV